MVMGTHSVVKINALLDVEVIGEYESGFIVYVAKSVLYTEEIKSNLHVKSF